MKYLILSTLLLAACGAPSDPPDTTQESSSTDPWAARTALEAAVPQLAECNDALRAENPEQIPAPVRIDAGGRQTVIEVACGSAPGTGAYGQPLALLVEYEAVESGLDGPSPHQIFPTAFVERNAEGVFGFAGFVTQAIPLYDDVQNGLVHMLYKSSGAGQCGLLVTYDVVAWGNGFEFIGETRERTCDAPPCDDGSCYNPLTWDVKEVQL